MSIRYIWWPSRLGVPGWNSSVLTSLHALNPAISFDLTNKALIVLILAGVGALRGINRRFLLGAIEAAGVYLVGTPYRKFLTHSICLDPDVSTAGIDWEKGMKHLLLLVGIVICLALVPMVITKAYILN